MKRSTLAPQKKAAGSYSKKMASGHVPVRHSDYPKFTF